MPQAELTMHRALLAHYQRAIDSLTHKTSMKDKIYLMTFQLIVEYLEELIRAVEERQKEIIWYGACMTPEIFLAMDLQPICLEMPLPLLASMDHKAVYECVDLSHKEGIPPEVCSMSKGTLGMVLAGEFPRPDIFVGPALPCENIKTVYQIFPRYAQAPCFFLDAPYGDRPEDIEFYTNEFKRMVAFLEEQTGKSLDYQRLREILEETNRADEVLLEWSELRKATPCPQQSRFLCLSGVVNKVSVGKPESVDLYKLLRDDAKARVMKKEGVVKRERKRVIWFQPLTFFDLHLYDWLERELGAVIPIDMYNYGAFHPVDTSTPESMLRGLALKSLNMPMARQTRGPSEFFTDDLFRACQEYQGDCVIIGGHLGCKQVWGIQGLIKSLCQEMETPLLIVDMDVFDNRAASMEVIKEKISSFFLTIAGQ